MSLNKGTWPTGIATRVRERTGALACPARSTQGQGLRTGWTRARGGPALDSSDRIARGERRPRQLELDKAVPKYCAASAIPHGSLGVGGHAVTQRRLLIA